MVTVTGLGSLPGTDFRQAFGMTLEQVPDLPYLPELPARGPWAGLIGRGTALLAGLDAEYAAGQWRLSGSPGMDQRRARSLLRDDLDRAQEYAPDYSGAFKVGVPGPGTLAAALLRPRGGRVLADRGARTDVAASLAHGVADLVTDLLGRWPGLQLVLQVDEPALPAVLAGSVPTEGGFFRHRAVDLPEAVASLAALTGAADAHGVRTAVVHCCAAGLPLDPMVGPSPDGAGFTAVSLDLDTLAASDRDGIGRAMEAGATLYLGCQPASGPPLPAGALARRVLAWVRPLELGPVAAERLVLTPACGLAGSDRVSVEQIFAALRAAASQVDEELLS